VDLLTAILACSVYASDDALVRAIAQSNSHGNEFAVVDAAAQADSGDPRQPEPRTLDAAMGRLEEVLSKDGRPLLGWMQLPPDWVTMFGRDLREAFDPCVNVSVGTAMLSAFDYECSRATAGAPPAPRHGRSRVPRSATRDLDRRACVVRKYGEAIGMPDFGVVTTLELRYQRSFDGAQASSPIQVGPGATQWGADCVFLTLATDDGGGAAPSSSR
jgi:hypothetical protein